MLAVRLDAVEAARLDWNTFIGWDCTRIEPMTIAGGGSRFRGGAGPKPIDEGRGTVGSRARNPSPLPPQVLKDAVGVAGTGGIERGVLPKLCLGTPIWWADGLNDR